MLQSIAPDATREEVAAIVAALAVATASASVIPGAATDTLDEWVRTSRLRAHRAGLRRGPWRLSGRLTRRARA